MYTASLCKAILIIRGYCNDTGDLVVDWTISFPHYDIQDQPITLTVSTGTPISTILPAEATRIGLDPILRTLPVAGVRVVKADLTFQDDEHDPVTLHAQPLRIMKILEVHHFWPVSLMGNDIIGKWAPHYDQTNRVVAFNAENQAKQGPKQKGNPLRPSGTIRPHPD